MGNSKMVRSWQARNIFIFILTFLFGFSEAYYPHLAQHTKGNHYGDFQDPSHHGHFYPPDYFGQSEHLKHPSLPEQSSSTDRLRNFNYHGHFQQLNFADPSHHLNHFNQHQQHNELEKHANRNKLLLRTSPGEHQQLNYHDMIHYPNQFHHLTHPGQIQQHNQQGELEKFGDLSHPPFYNSDGEYHQINYRGNLHYPSQYQQHNYFSRDHQLNQQGGPEQLGNLSELELHNSTGEHHADYHDKLSYSNQFQQLNYPNQDQQLNQQSQHKHLNQLELHQSTREHQHLDNHDMLSYSNHSQHLNYSDQDQQLNQQSEHKHLNQPELHQSTGEHQHLDNHDMLSYSNQSQHLNYSDQDQLLNHQGEHEKLGNLSHSHLHNSDGETHQINDQVQQLNISEVGQLNQQDVLKELVNLNQPKIDNSLEEHSQINYRSMLDHPIQLQELNHFSRDQHLNNLNQAQLHNFSGDHQQDHVNEVPVVQKQNEPEPSKLVSYNQEHEHLHQPVNLGHLHPNEKHSYPDNLPQLSNVGPHQQLDRQSHSAGSQYSNGPELPRYAREDQQPIYHDNIVPSPGLQDHAENSEPSQIPSFPHQVYAGKINYRSSPEIFDYSSLQQQLANPSRFQQLHQQFGQFGQLMHPSRFPNPADFSQFHQPNFFRQSGYPSNPILRSYSKRAPDFSSIKGPGTMLKNSETHFKQASNHQQQQGYPEQTVESKDINVHEKSNNLDNLQQQSNPDMFHQLNQSNQLGKPENSSELQQQINSTDGQQLNLSSNPQDTAANLTSLDQIHPEKQKHPKQVENSTDKNLTEQSNISSQFNQLNISDNISKPNNLLHTEELVNLNESQLPSNFTEDQQLNHTSESPQSNPQNQSQLNGIPKLQNVSSLMEHPVNLSEANMTSNQSQLQEHSHVDHFKQNNNSNAANLSANLDKLQLRNNFTGYGQQNHSDSSNGNISANKSENATANLQPPQPYLRQQRQLEIPNYPSHMQYYFRSSQPQQFNPFNQINKPNMLMQPMDQHNHPSSWTENQQLNYPIPPAICYLEQKHGPCGEIIPSFFYNPVTKHCERFIYGGCLGNANNFATFEECESVCMVYPQNGLPETKYPQEWEYDEDPALPLWHPGPALVHEFCSLDKSTGPCRAMFRRYFFNPVTKNCEEFIYGGCYGNANNFFTKEECEFICTSIK